MEVPSSSIGYDLYRFGSLRIEWGSEIPSRMAVTVSVIACGILTLLLVWGKKERDWWGLYNSATRSTIESASVR